jgi:CXXX repeat modification system protein
MLKEFIVKITENEKKEVMNLHERLNGLNELILSVKSFSKYTDDLDDLYEKIVCDTGKTKVLFDKWWVETAKKYSLKSIEGHRWEIDFYTNEIFLI